MEDLDKIKSIYERCRAEKIDGPTVSVLSQKEKNEIVDLLQDIICVIYKGSLDAICREGPSKYTTREWEMISEGQAYPRYEDKIYILNMAINKIKREYLTCSKLR